MQVDRPTLGGHWRYTAWVKWDPNTTYADWTQVDARELYDLRTLDPTDPDFYDFEGFSANVVDDPAHASIVAAMHEELETSIKSFY